jgi:hypothetical protein
MELTGSVPWTVRVFLKPGVDEMTAARQLAKIAHWMENGAVAATRDMEAAMPDDRSKSHLVADPDAAWRGMGPLPDDLLPAFRAAVPRHTNELQTMPASDPKADANRKNFEIRCLEELITDVGQSLRKSSDEIAQPITSAKCHGISPLDAPGRPSLEVLLKIWRQELRKSLAKSTDRDAKTKSTEAATAFLRRAITQLCDAGDIPALRAFVNLAEWAGIGEHDDEECGA